MAARPANKNISGLKKSEHVDPLAYPLLFPYGEGGWHPELRREGRQVAAYNRLTPMQFYAYRLMLRDYEPLDDEDEDKWPCTEPTLPHSGGYLFQQWLCDVYSRAEAQRLSWVLLRQEELRADTYQGLYDALIDPSFVPGRSKAGKKIFCTQRTLAARVQ